MSDLDILLNDDATDTDLVKNLRKALKAANTERVEKDKKLAEYEKNQRTSSLADVLKGKGIDNPKAVGLYPKDADATPEAVDAWLAEYGELLGIQKQESSADAATQQAATTISQMSSQAPSSTTSFDVNALVAEIANAKNDEELAAAYAKAGLK